MNLSSVLRLPVFAALALLVCPVLPADSPPVENTTQAEVPPPRKVCVAHRGASAHAPEHTAAAYKMAMDMGADFVEQDLAMTRDGQLVCIHDITLERTTNVAQVYPTRSSTKDPSGQKKKTWRVSDFTLAEIKKLDAGSWFDPAFAGERILTFQEAIDLVKTKPGTGIYPELKDADYHHRQGLEIEDAVLKVLAANGLDKSENQKAMPVVIQSFEPDTLKYVREKTGKTYFLVQLVDIRQARLLMSDTGMAAVAQYAQGLGPSIMILTADRSKVDLAHKLGLVLHPYTVNEKSVQKPFPDVKTWTHHLLYKLGVDGVFTDNPDEFPRE